MALRGGFGAARRWRSGVGRYVASPHREPHPLSPSPYTERGTAGPAGGVLTAPSPLSARGRTSPRLERGRAKVEEAGVRQPFDLAQGEQATEATERQTPPPFPLPVHGEGDRGTDLTPLPLGKGTGNVSPSYSLGRRGHREGEQCGAALAKRRGEIRSQSPSGTPPPFPLPVHGEGGGGGKQDAQP